MILAIGTFSTLAHTAPLTISHRMLGSQPTFSPGPDSTLDLVIGLEGSNIAPAGRSEVAIDSAIFTFRPLPSPPPNTQPVFLDGEIGPNDLPNCIAAFEDAAYIGLNCSLGGGVIYRPTITADRVFAVSVDVDVRPANSLPEIILFSTIFRIKNFRLDRSSVTIAPAAPLPGSVPAPRTILLLSIAFLSLSFARAMHDRGRGGARLTRCPGTAQRAGRRSNTVALLTTVPLCTSALQVHAGCSAVAR